MKTRELTTCAFAIALGVILLVFGFHLTFGEYFWYFWAALMVSVPKTPAGRCCTFAATSVLAVMMCASCLYLCSYVLWLGPYSLLWCLTENRPGRGWPVVRYMFFYAGALAVLWTTPMLFVQLGTVPAETRLIGAAAAAAASIPACFGYTLLYRKMRDLLHERILSRI